MCHLSLSNWGGEGVDKLLRGDDIIPVMGEDKKATS